MDEVTIFGGVMFVVLLTSIVVGCFLALRWASKTKDGDE